MANKIGIFSVYLGRGVYIGGVVAPENACKNSIILDSDAALVLSHIDRAAVYGRAAAVRVCHFARRAGLGAWIVQGGGVNA